MILGQTLLTAKPSVVILMRVGILALCLSSQVRRNAHTGREGGDVWQVIAALIGLLVTGVPARLLHCTPVDPPPC